MSVCVCVCVCVCAGPIANLSSLYACLVRTLPSPSLSLSPTLLIQCRALLPQPSQQQDYTSYLKPIYQLVHDDTRQYSLMYVHSKHFQFKPVKIYPPPPPHIRTYVYTCIPIHPPPTCPPVYTNTEPTYAHDHIILTNAPTYIHIYACTCICWLLPTTQHTKFLQANCIAGYQRYSYACMMQGNRHLMHPPPPQLHKLLQLVLARNRTTS